MITTLRKHFFWTNLKAYLVDYLSQCLECQQVKDEHQHLAGLLQPLPIHEWKWEVISLDFITDFPLTKKQNDSIMVVVDKLNKSAHFIPVKSTQGCQCCRNIPERDILTSWSTQDGNF